jgi:hypothetical protein
MITLHKTGRVLQSGLGIALAALFALVSGSGSARGAEALDASGDEAIGEAQQAFTVSPCTLAGGTELGSLEVLMNGPVVVACYRTKAVMSGGPPPPVPPGLASCWSIGKSLGCPGF